MIYVWQHTCLSNTRVLVDKPFWYRAPVASPLCTTMTTGTNLPTPPLILTVKHKKKTQYCLTISSVDPPKTNPALLIYINGTFTRATLELRKLALQNMIEEDGKEQHQHQNYRNSQSTTTFVPFQSTPAITQGTIIHMRRIIHNI
jgi:predicted RNA binding protein YcfA (HicA-like mRNA interferase family)